MIVSLLGLTAACGDAMGPSGGRAKAPAPTAADANPDAVPVDDAGDDGEEPAAPAVADAADPLLAACQKQGAVLDRRRGECSETYLTATSFTCDRAGIRSAFANTGFQVDQILDRSLGREGFKDDVGEGYAIDQCGESDDRRIVYLVKDDGAGSQLVREIEAKKDAAVGAAP